VGAGPRPQPGRGTPREKVGQEDLRVACRGLGETEERRLAHRVVAAAIPRRSLVGQGLAREVAPWGARNAVSHTIRRAREFVATGRATRKLANHFEKELNGA
jgi:hypothetical protein